MIHATPKVSVLYEILGPGTKGFKTFICAVCETERLLFSENIPVDDIHVTKDIYPRVAKRLNKGTRSVARQVERMGNQCWSSMDEAQKKKYLGKVLKDIRAPRDMLFYLAFYVHFRRGFYEILEEQPEVLFGVVREE
ncbi:MAG TPA: hypothetical protein IAB98_03900 [Candidatus Egerieimonas intestinavium]|uniref:Sporulation initiation factor Spo0A C-terminal domain-containing protein n=1 Tax=Candidatus Egerieimonas intestinavium TaxID=2840777 RepID=A0A9D1EIA5_9FIRM|nr:hypothetical protein [Candidatus Egerieimonas intestinavium]